MLQKEEEVRQKPAHEALGNARTLRNDNSSRLRASGNAGHEFAGMLRRLEEGSFFRGGPRWSVRPALRAFVLAVSTDSVLSATYFRCRFGRFVKLFLNVRTSHSWFAAR